MFSIIKLRSENKRLKEELAQKELTIQYLNGCINKANKRTLYLKKEADALRAVLASHVSYLDFPNSSVEPDNQISIHDILEN